MNYDSGMKPIEIAKLFKIFPHRVNYRIHHPIIFPRKRRTKLTRNEKNIIVKLAKYKPINIASTKKIRDKYNKLCKFKKEDKTQKKVCLSSIYNTLNRYISYPKKMRKVFFLSETQKERKLKFLKFMEKNKISPEDIFILMKVYLI